MKHYKFQIGDVVQLDPKNKYHIGCSYLIPQEEYDKKSKVVSLIDLEHVRLDNKICGFSSWHVESLKLVPRLDLRETSTIV